jgi:tRNA uridine 5-carboxymethylaminomethyl modification enzyme
VATLREARVAGGQTAYDVLRRPETKFADLAREIPALAAVPPGTGKLIEIRIKYDGYITRQSKAIDRFGQLEQKLIPNTIDYAAVPGLRNEAKQKLTKFTPRSLGQALRISGITPADVTVLAVHLDSRRRRA